MSKPFQFSLRMVFVVVTLVALTCSLIATVQPFPGPLSLLNAVAFVIVMLIIIGSGLWYLVGACVIVFSRRKPRDKPVRSDSASASDSSEAQQGSPD